MIQFKIGMNKNLNPGLLLYSSGNSHGKDDSLGF